MAFVWTDEREAALKQDWRDGLSGSVIAARFGPGCSRCAVLGKIHRMGLSGRTTTTRQQPRMSRPQMKAAPWRKRYKLSGAAAAEFAQQRDDRLEAQTGPDLVVPPAERRKFADLEPGDCRWPFLDPKHPDFHYCNRLAIGASDRLHRGIQPYCEFHCKRAYNLPAYTGTNIHRVGNAFMRGGHQHQPALSTKALVEFDEMAD